MSILLTNNNSILNEPTNSTLFNIYQNNQSIFNSQTSLSEQLITYPLSNKYWKL